MLTGETGFPRVRLVVRCRAGDASLAVPAGSPDSIVETYVLLRVKIEIHPINSSQHFRTRRHPYLPRLRRLLAPPCYLFARDADTMLSGHPAKVDMSQAASQRFPTTQWTSVARAGETGTLAAQTLAHLLESYLLPLRAHLMIEKRLPPEKADDLLQSFVAEKV